MFTLAILIGIYSYLIFSLGLLGVLYKQNVIFITLIYLLVCLIGYRFKVKDLFMSVPRFYKENRQKLFKDRLLMFIILLILIQGLVNMIGVLGPEIGFDALWYHLVLPKIYLINNSIFHIPGGLLYYSDMPKLTEMLYVAGLSFGNEILAKFIHFSFGILCLIALYQLSRKFFSKKLALLTVLIFYGNLVVGWESVSAYIDLARTFFEIMVLFGFVNWIQTKDRKWLIESSVMMGLAITTKLVALGSLIIFSVLIVGYYYKSKNDRKDLFKNLFSFWFISLLIPLPWFVFSYIHTGNPIYPLMTSLYSVGFNISLINPIKFIADVWNLLINSSDPISPIYLIFLPLFFVFYKYFKDVKIIIYYSVLALLVWYIEPRTGGGRFILPYLPAFSIVSVGLIDHLSKSRNKYEAKIVNICIIVILITGIFSIFYRTVANSKYFPVIIGIESERAFLTKNLNFKFADFYDTDNYFKTHIKKNDKVLLYGFHNLYYIDFPFIDSSWVVKGDQFNYIATQNTFLPQRFKSWNMIYNNSRTGVSLYSLGGIKWVY